MKSLRYKLDRGLQFTIAALLAIMALNVVWQVFTRFVMHSPSSYTEELARYTMIWLALLGAAYCVGRRSHLALDLVPSLLKGNSRRRLEIMIQLMVLFFALAVLVGGGGRLVWLTLVLGQTSAALEIKLGYVYLAVPISGVIITLYSLIEIGTIWRAETEEAPTTKGLTDE